MLATTHPVDFVYTRQQLDAMVRLARQEDLEYGGRYDARSAAINVWSHHWQHPATRQESAIIGTFHFERAPTPRLYEVETDAGFTLEDLLGDLGRLELKALGWVKHGDVPPQGED